jgi:hypothetical protein
MAENPVRNFIFTSDSFVYVTMHRHCSASEGWDNYFILCIYSECNLISVSACTYQQDLNLDAKIDFKLVEVDFTKYLKMRGRN